MFEATFEQLGFRRLLQHVFMHAGKYNQSAPIINIFKFQSIILYKLFKQLLMIRLLIFKGQSFRECLLQLMLLSGLQQQKQNLILIPLAQ